jgi:hypothetical protein
VRGAIFFSELLIEASCDQLLRQLFNGQRLKWWRRDRGFPKRKAASCCQDAASD